MSISTIIFFSLNFLLLLGILFVVTDIMRRQKKSDLRNEEAIKSNNAILDEQKEQISRVLLENKSILELVKKDSETMDKLLREIPQQMQLLQDIKKGIEAIKPNNTTERIEGVRGQIMNRVIPLETSSIYTKTELKFIELKNRVYAAIKKAVDNAVCLTAEQRSVEPQWCKSFDELYGKGYCDLGIEKYFTVDGFKKQNVDQEDCLKIPPTFAKRDFSTPLGVLEAVLLCELKECVEDHYSEPAKLHIRYRELLDK